MYIFIVACNHSSSSNSESASGHVMDELMILGKSATTWMGCVTVLLRQGESLKWAVSSLLVTRSGGGVSRQWLMGGWAQGPNKMALDQRGSVPCRTLRIRHYTTTTMSEVKPAPAPAAAPVKKEKKDKKASKKPAAAEAQYPLEVKTKKTTCI